MKRKTWLTTLVLLIVSIFCCFGCADVELIRMVSSNTNIIDRLVVTLDKQKLGNSYDTVKNAVEDDMLSFRNYVGTWINSFKEDYPQVHLQLLDQIVCEVPPAQDNVLYINLTFANSSAFQIFYGIGENSNSNYNEAMLSEEYVQAMEDVGPFIRNIIEQDYKTEEFGLFLYKYSMLNTKGILDGIEDYELNGQNIYDRYSELSAYTLDDIDFTQIFVYPEDRLYSNADVKDVIDGYTYLAWDLSDKSSDFEMSIYKLAPQTATWYIVALVISAVVVVSLLIVFSLKSKKTKEEKVTKQEVEKNER